MNFPKKHIKILSKDERERYEWGIPTTSPLFRSDFYKDKYNKNIAPLMSVAKKDIDNVEKVNYDVLQDDKVKIILDDRLTVSNRTRKFYSLIERTEIRIYYNSDDTIISEYVKRDVHESMEYLMYKLDWKYRSLHGMSDKRYAKHFYDNGAQYLITYKSKRKSIKANIIKRVNGMYKTELVALYTYIFTQIQKKRIRNDVSGYTRDKLEAYIKKHYETLVQ